MEHGLQGYICEFLCSSSCRSCRHKNRILTSLQPQRTKNKAFLPFYSWMLNVEILVSKCIKVAWNEVRGWERGSVEAWGDEPFGPGWGVTLWLSPLPHRHTSLSASSLSDLPHPSRDRIRLHPGDSHLQHLSEVTSSDWLWLMVDDKQKAEDCFSHFEQLEKVSAFRMCVS